MEGKKTIKQNGSQPRVTCKAKKNKRNHHKEITSAVLDN